MKSKALGIAIIGTGALGATLTIIGIFVVESVPMFVSGFVLVLICSGLTWAGNQAELDKLAEEEKARKEEQTK